MPNQTCANQQTTNPEERGGQKPRKTECLSSLAVTYLSSLSRRCSTILLYGPKRQPFLCRCTLFCYGGWRLDHKQGLFLVCITWLGLGLESFNIYCENLWSCQTYFDRVSNGPEQANTLCNLVFCVFFFDSTQEFLDFVPSNTELETQVERGFSFLVDFCPVVAAGIDLSSWRHLAKTGCRSGHGVSPQTPRDAPALLLCNADQTC
jgi:hypothetical protein